MSKITTKIVWSNHLDHQTGEPCPTSGQSAPDQDDAQCPLGCPPEVCCTIETDAPAQTATVWYA